MNKDKLDLFIGLINECSNMMLLIIGINNEKSDII